MTNEDLKVKFGSDDMVFWRDIISAEEADLIATKKKLKYIEASLNMAKEQYKKAEEENKKCT
jgi:hypothetical protein